MVYPEFETGKNPKITKIQTEKMSMDLHRTTVLVFIFSGVEVIKIMITTVTGIAMK